MRKCHRRTGRCRLKEERFVLFQGTRNAVEAAIRHADYLCIYTKWGWKNEETFKLRGRGKNVRTELIAGLTTFFLMVCFLIVNADMFADSYDSGAGLRQPSDDFLCAQHRLGRLPHVRSGVSDAEDYAVCL